MYFEVGAHGIPWGGPLGSHGGGPWDPRVGPWGPIGSWGPMGPWGPGPLGTQWPLGTRALGDPGPWGPKIAKVP